MGVCLADALDGTLGRLLRSVFAANLAPFLEEGGAFRFFGILGHCTFPWRRKNQLRYNSQSYMLNSVRSHNSVILPESQNHALCTDCPQKMGAEAARDQYNKNSPAASRVAADAS